MDEIHLPVTYLFFHLAGTNRFMATIPFGELKFSFDKSTLFSCSFEGSITQNFKKCISNSVVLL